MKILGAMVEWNHGYGNEPELLILANNIPLIEEMIFESVEVDNELTLYLAEKEGKVFYLAHDKSSEHGHGGNDFTIRTKEGMKTMRGPWSSRSGAMNNYFSTQSTEVLADNGKGLYGIALTIEKAKETIERFLPGIELVKERKDYPKELPDLCYSIKLKDDLRLCEGCKKPNDDQSNKQCYRCQRYEDGDICQ